LTLSYGLKWHIRNDPPSGDIREADIDY